jgi:tetratricopeptide (TPR) repeat protein
MEPESYRRLRAHFLRALELPAEERAGYVERALPDEPALAHELSRLVAAAGNDDSFLLDAPRAPRWDGALPEQVGEYRVRGLLGQGGMGVVLLAEQARPRREVALKLLRHGLADPEALRRFRLEAELLGRLQHPGIAQVFEAGTWRGPWGEQPFLALELVRGEVLTHFARSHALDLRARLELLAAICDAVQHAHQKGVIHRDLKPANVLVDSEGRPKVLDFGVARLVQAEGGGESLLTLQGVLGTPAYMSPEQAAGGALDTRSDIYSLGCVAYELLAGRVPIAVDDAPSLLDALRAVREREPARLGALDARLRGDVETIVAKALAKDPERRYASASDLAADVRRHLAHQPIAARPPTTGYLLSRFVRRQRALVAGTAAVLATLLLGLAGTWSGLARARIEAEEKRAVNDFLLSLFAAPDPEVDGRDVRVVELLERWAQELEHAFLDRPRVRAALLERLGATWRGLGLFERAEAPLREALALREASADRADPERLSTQSALGALLAERGAFDEARTRLGDVLAVRRETLGAEHPDTLDAWANVAAVRMQERRFDLAVPELSEVLEALRRAYGPRHDKSLVVENNLALALLYAHRLEEAERLFEHVHAGWRALAGDDHPTTIAALGNLAMLRQAQGRSEDAERIYREVAGRAARVLGADHPGALHPLNNLVSLLYGEGRLAEAEVLARGVLAARRAKLSSSHPKTLHSIGWHARLLDELGRDDEAEALYREALAGWDAQGGGEIDSALALRTHLAGILRDRGDLAGAEGLYRDVERVRGAREDPLDTDRWDNLAGLARTRWLAGSPAEAEELLLAALLGRLSHSHGDAAGLATIERWLVELRADPAWLAREEEQRTRQLDECAADAAPRDLARAERRLAAVLAASGRHAEAEDLLQSALERLDDAPPDERRELELELYLLCRAGSRAREADERRARLLLAPGTGS